MIVRWGIGELSGLLGELSIERPLLVTTERFAQLDLPVSERFTGVQRHSPLEVVSAAMLRQRERTRLVALGGGARSTSKAVSAGTGLPLVAIPTTYAAVDAVLRHA
jgi:glycerol dehydrogenase-like iron-containing ADH family enzyme